MGTRTTIGPGFLGFGSFSLTLLMLQLFYFSGAQAQSGQYGGPSTPDPYPAYCCYDCEGTTPVNEHYGSFVTAESEAGTDDVCVWLGPPYVECTVDPNEHPCGS